MMDTDALSAALRAATEDVDAPPGFAERVQRGARRRLVRRRYRIGVVVLVLLAIGTGLTALSDHLLPVVTGTHDSKPTLPSDDPRLHEATKGDLATDLGFLDQARTAWQRDLRPPELIESERNDTSFTDPLGQPSVYWAGNTPAGKAAVVLQSFAWQSSAAGTPPATIVEIGVVANSASTSEPTLQGQQTIGNTPQGQARESFAFGRDDATVLTMAESGLRVYSPGPIVDPHTGKVSRRWQNLPYVDGVAVFDVELQGPANGRTVVELAQQPDAAHPHPAKPGTAYQPVLGDGFTSDSGPDSVDPRLNWPLAAGLHGASTGAPGTNPPSWSTVFDNALHEGGYSDPYVSHPSDLNLSGTSGLIGESYWQIAYRLSGGGILILGEELVGTEGQLYAVTVNDPGNVLNIAYGGMILSGDALPVRYQLPDGDGLLLAAYGSVISTPTQSDSDVLVVPSDTAQVTVTPNGGHPRTIQLKQ